MLVTPFLDEAERLCKRVAVMKQGRIVALTSEQATSPWLEAVSHVRGVSRQGSRVVVEGEGPVLQHVAAALLQRGSRRVTWR